MNHQTYLAFDYGTKLIGVAVGGTRSGSAQGLTTVRVGKKGPDWQVISRLVEQWLPNSFVVGLPLNMDGSTSKLTKLAEKFGNSLNQRYNLQVRMVDERLTTVAAKEQLKQSGISPSPQHKTDLDEIAARTILQAFLDDTKAGAIGGGPDFD